MLDKLYLEYSFLGLTKEEFNELIKDKKIEESIKEYIKKHKSVLLNIEDLSKLTTLDLELEDYIYILKNNNKVYSFIERLHKENREINNSSIENLLCAYELINDIDVSIEIENDDNFYLEDYYTENTFKQFLYYIRNYRSLSSLETKNLFIRMSKNDNEARNLLILHNIGLVIFIAKKYISFNVDLIDLIQEGIIGLMKAIEKFDYTKNYKFSTYAYYWIKLYIDRYLSYTKNAFSIPVHIDIKLSEYNRKRNELEQKLGRHLLNKEL